MGVFCEESLFMNGITMHQTWFQVNILKFNNQKGKKKKTKRAININFMILFFKQYR